MLEKLMLYIYICIYIVEFGREKQKTIIFIMDNEEILKAQKGKAREREREREKPSLNPR